MTTAQESVDLLRSTDPDDVEAEMIRTIERQRLRVWVDKNMEVARRLHAEDFELVNPGGMTLSKDRYLDAVATGELGYLVCEVDSPMRVRVHTDAAVIRYCSKIQVTFRNQQFPLHGFCHTDFYVKNANQRQAVWSHATAIQEPT